MRSSPLAGTAYLLAFITVGCRAGDTTSAPATPPVEMIIAAASPTTTSSVVGSPVSELPAVVIRDVRGGPLPGIPVTFAVTRGGGSIVGVTTNTKTVTNASGVAALESWIVGPRPGVNEVTATSPSVPSVRFVVNAVVGPPALLRKIQGDDQYAPAGGVVPIRPSVRVVDGLHNPIAGIAVVFAVTKGDGTVTGAAATTDSAGLAVVESWTLGSVQHQTLTAAAIGLAPVHFVAEALQAVQTCVSSAPLAAGMNTSSTLTTGSCKGEDGRFLETFSVLSTGTETHEFTLVSSDFDTYLELRDARGRPVANSDAGGSATSSRVKAILPQGTYTVVVSSAQPSHVGQFTIAHALASSDVTGCAATAIARGATTTRQFITPADCVVSSSRSEDRYRVWVAARTSLLIHLEDWSYSNQYFEVMDAKGTVLEMSRMTSYYNYEVEFTAPADGYYYISVVGGPIEWGIAYTLSVR